MKIKKLFTLALLATTSLLASCGGGGNSSSQGGGGGGGGGDSSIPGPGPSGGGDSSTPIPANYIRVTFYIDFNQIGSDEYYAQQDVPAGGKLTKPADPTTAPFEEFPRFLGWSYKELIKSPDDLWNFDTDTVNVKEGENTYSIFGIWDI